MTTISTFQNQSFHVSTFQMSKNEGNIRLSGLQRKEIESTVQHICKHGQLELTVKQNIIFKEIFIFLQIQNLH